MRKIYLSRILVLLFLISSIVFGYYLFNFDVLSLQYSIYYILFVVIALLVMMYLSDKHKFFRFLISLICGGLIFIQIYGVYFINTVDAFFNQLTVNENDKLIVLVKRSSDYDENSTFNGKKIGVKDYVDPIYNNKLKMEIKGELINYNDYETLFDDLDNKVLDAILIDKEHLNDFKEAVNNYDLKSKQLKTIDLGDIFANYRVDDITNKPFTIYISGIDKYGSIPRYGLSDVNMLVTINPKTKKILMTSLPRDTYMENTCNLSNDVKDKLTHIGNDGVRCSMESIANYFGIDVNYYIKVNFSSVEGVVNALNGIQVHSDYDFNSYDMTEVENHFEFKKGNNYLNGRQALVFSRIRNAFEDGDLQRNKNQQFVLKGIINKLLSVTSIGNFEKVLTVLSENMKTSVNSSELKKLLKYQLTNNISWTIESQSLQGVPDLGYTASYPDEELAIFLVDNDSKMQAINKLQLLLNDK